MSSHGISGAGRAELTAVAARRRFITPDDVAAELGVDREVAARNSRIGRTGVAASGAARPLYPGARRGPPRSWSQDALVVATAVWSPCYFSGWTAASHWGLTEQVFRTTVVKHRTRVAPRRAPARLRLPPRARARTARVGDGDELAGGGAATSPTPHGRSWTSSTHRESAAVSATPQRSSAPIWMSTRVSASVEYARPARQPRCASSASVPGGVPGLGRPRADRGVPRATFRRRLAA